MNYAQVLAGELRGAFDRQDHPAFTRLLQRMVDIIEYAGPVLPKSNDERTLPEWIGVDWGAIAEAKPGAGSTNTLTARERAEFVGRMAMASGSLLPSTPPVHKAAANEHVNAANGCTRKLFPCDCQGPMKHTCMYRAK